MDRLLGLGLRKTEVPEDVSGDWRVEKFNVSKDDVMIHNLRCEFKPGQGSRRIEPGEYTRLMHGRTLVMSDTHAELSDHIEPVRYARGHVLINGLGLGVVAVAVLSRSAVEKLTVIEVSQDVINLVGPTLATGCKNGRIEIICADALTWKPPKGMRYGAVWHDIWNHICADNLDGIKTLHRRYGRRCDWQGSWCRYLCEMYR